MSVALLAHEGFPERAKTAVGVLRYGDHDVAAVLDRAHAGERVGDHVPAVPDAPIVAGMETLPGPVDTLIVGVAPIGGAFDESWRPDVRTALERGCTVVSGLHDFLAEDDEFARLADEHGGTIRDVRRPPADTPVAAGTADRVDARVLATVGTECSTGKMTTSFAIRDAARERGVDAAVVPTGQTGVIVAGWGTVVDRVPADFAAGVVEGMVLQAAAGHDLLVVEGQGALAHPAYSGVTLSILHGAQPDAMVLCHEPGREVVHGFERFDVPALDEYAALYERAVEHVAPAPVAACALDTSAVGEAEARDAVEAAGRALDAPATDPVRFGVDDAVWEALA